MWKKRDIDKVPKKYIDVTSKRFSGQTTLLHELIDNLKYIVFEFFSKNDKPLLDPLDIINKVITDVKYPLNAWGRPTNLHYFQAFRRFWGSCYKTFRNDYDYFQFASETAWLKLGDCEDSSILTGAGLENLKVLDLVDYFIAFGKVFSKDIFLGYHAWVISKINGTWRLVETTLDTPYSNILEIPKINISTNSWKVGDITYVAYILWNKKELWEWSESMGLKEYLEKTHKEKETKKKYKEMSKSYYKLMKKKCKV